MADDGASHTGDVAAEEADASLLEGVELVFGLVEEFVDGRDGLFEGCEFDLVGGSAWLTLH